MLEDEASRKGEMEATTMFLINWLRNLPFARRWSFLRARRATVVTNYPPLTPGEMRAILKQAGEDA